jgi:hypothetical protein
MQIWTCSAGNKNQMWQATTGDRALTSFKWANTTQCLDLKGGSQTQGTPVSLSHTIPNTISISVLASDLVMLCRQQQPDLGAAICLNCPPFRVRVFDWDSVPKLMDQHSDSTIWLRHHSFTRE